MNTNRISEHATADSGRGCRMLRKPEELNRLLQKQMVKPAIICISNEIKTHEVQIVCPNLFI